MKITNEIKKFNIDAVKAMNLTFSNATSLSFVNCSVFLVKMAATPRIGIKSKDDNNMYKNKKKK